jgi:glycosyltransferase involved in cell wall biosynthesis
LISQSQPLVSIGIPTYNRLSGLKNALKCIREQTYSNLEIIVSDNCSPGDEIDRYMDTVIKEDPRVRYFRQSHNIGALANFEFVLTKATGKYFAWAADDDSCEDRFVEEIIDQMEQDTDIVLCACDVKNIDEHDNPIGIECLESIRPINDWNKARRLFFRYPTSNIFFCIYGIYNTQILRMCDLQLSNGWKGYMTNGEVPFLAQVSSYGKIVAIPEPLKIYRRHSQSIYYEEIKRIKKIDVFMMRLVIRAKLCKLALLDKSDFPTRISLLNSVIKSFFSSIKPFSSRINLRGKIAYLLPKKVKEYAKRLLHLR